MQYDRNNFFAEGKDVGEQWNGAGADDPGMAPPDPTSYQNDDASMDSDNFYGSTDADAQGDGFYGEGAAVDDYSPEQMRDINCPGTMKAPLQYPSSLSSLNQFIIFYFFEVVRARPKEMRKEKPGIIINLPIPSNLVEQFGMNYNEKSLGTALGFLEQTKILDPETILDVAGGGEAGIQKSAQAGQAVGKELQKRSNQLAVLQAFSRKVGTDAFTTAVERVTGTVLNPYQALQFDGVRLREHTFSYRFSPNSEREASALKSIIREFKTRMHPAKDGLLFTFPDACKISFAPDGTMPYEIDMCYLKSMSVNYAPSNTPAFFQGGQYPAEIEFSLTFGEIRPLTKEFFDPSSYNGYNGGAGGTEGTFGGDIEDQEGGFYGDQVSNLTDSDEELVQLSGPEDEIQGEEGE